MIIFDVFWDFSNIVRLKTMLAYVVLGADNLTEQKPLCVQRGFRYGDFRFPACCSKCYVIYLLMA
jgi:hypothetical protein